MSSKLSCKCCWNCIEISVLHCCLKPEETRLWFKSELKSRFAGFQKRDLRSSVYLQNLSSFYSCQSFWCSRLSKLHNVSIMKFSFLYWAPLSDYMDPFECFACFCMFSETLWEPVVRLLTYLGDMGKWITLARPWFHNVLMFHPSICLFTYLSIYLSTFLSLSVSLPI